MDGGRDRSPLYASNPGEALIGENCSTTASTKTLRIERATTTGVSLPAIVIMLILLILTFSITGVRGGKAKRSGAAARRGKARSGH